MSSLSSTAQKLVKKEKINRVSIVILDVDYFKQVNDRYGHLYGDKVLTRVAKKLKEVVGEDGVVGRIGGDEFMIVLNGINDDYSLRGILRAIRTQVKWEFKNDYENFQVTTSIGVAFSPNNGHEYEELFKKADFCLYMAVVTVGTYGQTNFEMGYAFKFLRVLTLILTQIFNLGGFIAGVVISVLLLIRTYSYK